MVPDPVAQVETGTGLVATLGRQIQARVCANQFFGSTTVGRIGVENDTTNQGRRSGHFLAGNRDQPKASNLLIGEPRWSSKIKIEVTGQVLAVAVGEGRAEEEI